MPIQIFNAKFEKVFKTFTPIYHFFLGGGGHFFCIFCFLYTFLIKKNYQKELKTKIETAKTKFGHDCSIFILKSEIYVMGKPSATCHNSHFFALAGLKA